jgi:sec-independent protein translocase protein TatA
MDFFGMGPWEIFLILVIALIFLGPGKIVDFARTLGKWVRAIRRAGNDFTAAVTRELEKTGEEPPPATTKEARTAPPPPPSGDRDAATDPTEKDDPAK